MTAPDAIVVGLGAVGSAAAFQLARRGVRVLGIDRFAPPHELGSSHGETRITREAVGEGDAYVPFARRAHRIWREIEAETGDELLVACGGLILSGARSSHPKKAAFLDRTIAAAERHGIPHEVLSAEEIGARFPQFGLAGDERGYFEPGAGFVHPERCIAAQLRLAERAGAVLKTGETVLSVAPRGSGVRVETDRGGYEAGRAILAAGAWNPGLAGGSLSHMALHRQVLTWFEAEDAAAYAPGRFPVFIWLHGSEGEQSYGFPIPAGTSGIKLATETYEGALASPEAMNRAVGAGEIAHVYRAHVAGRLRGVIPRALRAGTCLYTLAPDSRFVVDAHPETDAVTIASACSGHGFKHSAAIGEALAEHVVDGRSRLDLSPFRAPGAGPAVAGPKAPDRSETGQSA